MALAFATKISRRCYSVVVKGSPPEPCDEVKRLLRTYKMHHADIMHIYDVFHYLKHLEDTEEVFVSATEITVESVKRLVVERRRWVMRILDQLLKLGGCEEEICWDEFLWIFIRFCSLNRSELSQALFQTILLEMKSPRKHYLTVTELVEYYKFYKECPIRSFSTQGFDFTKLPLTRFYISDFAELTQRFSVLLNPMVHLQRLIQEHLPGAQFWDNVDRADAFCRKIAHDFFVMETGRVHLRGEPPFRECCDNLVPDALGAIAVNEEQWLLRTSECRGGRGLRQVSVWGEQPAPEAVDKIKKRLDYEAEQARIQAEEEKAAKAHAEAKALQEKYRRAELLAAGDDIDELDSEATQSPRAGGPKEAWAETVDGQRPKDGIISPASTQGSGFSPGRRGPTAEQRRLGVPELVGGEPPPPPPPPPPEEAELVQIDARALSLKAATMDESDASPIDILPPVWMRSATCAPAQQLPSWGAPKLPRQGLGKGAQRTSGSEGVRFVTPLR